VAVVPAFRPHDSVDLINQHFAAGNPPSKSWRLGDLSICAPKEE
jgi:hypothetical protein